MSLILLQELGTSLPQRERIKGTSTTLVNLDPQGMSSVKTINDTFRLISVKKDKNSLKGKKIVLFFGRESHMLTRTFFTPKLAMIYQHLTNTLQDDVEFIYVSLDKTNQEFDRFTKSHRKCKHVDGFINLYTDPNHFLCHT
jgi:hypothetical protein